MEYRDPAGPDALSAWVGHPPHPVAPNAETAHHHEHQAQPHFRSGTVAPKAGNHEPGAHRTKRKANKLRRSAALWGPGPRIIDAFDVLCFFAVLKRGDSIRAKKRHSTHSSANTAHQRCTHADSRPKQLGQAGKTSHAIVSRVMNQPFTCTLPPNRLACRFFISCASFHQMLGQTSTKRSRTKPVVHISSVSGLAHGSNMGSCLGALADMRLVLGGAHLRFRMAEFSA